MTQKNLSLLSTIAANISDIMWNFSPKPVVGGPHAFVQRQLLLAPTVQTGMGMSREQDHHTVAQVLAHAFLGCSDPFTAAEHLFYWMNELADIYKWYLSLVPPAILPPSSLHRQALLEQYYYFLRTCPRCYYCVVNTSSTSQQTPHYKMNIYLSTEAQLAKWNHYDDTQLPKP